MEKYFKAVNGELTYEELRSICQKEVREGEYYNYENIRGVILRKLNGEISDKYFSMWLIVVSWALNRKHYYEISDTFDGFSFEDVFDRKCVLELLARFKAFDFELRNKKYIQQHRNQGLKVVYLRFKHCNWTSDSGIYIAYFVDYANKRFDIRLVDDNCFEYNDDILYCFIDDGGYWEDKNGFIHNPPLETWQENKLMGYFFDESENWIYDHSLNF